ncbi:NAD(P)H-dependent oxidoreductase [Urechidicola sp. KH5]
MTIIDHLHWRYATKKFDNSKKLSESQINILIEAFNLTATSYGLQPLKMLVISNQELKKQLQEHAYNQQQVSTCSHLLVICIKTDVDANYVDKKFDLEKEVRGIDESAISDFRGFLKNVVDTKSSADLELAAKHQSYIALGNLMTVCALEKIDSCPMEGFVAEKFDEVLDLKSYSLKSALLLPVGFRASDDFMSQLKKVRLPLTESIIEIK